MTNKCTPGEWVDNWGRVFSETGDGGARNTLIANCWLEKSKVLKSLSDEERANARLMASAKTTLAELRVAHHVMGIMCSKFTGKEMAEHEGAIEFMKIVDRIGKQIRHAEGKDLWPSE